MMESWEGVLVDEMLWRRVSRVVVAAVGVEVWSWSWMIVRARPMSVGRWVRRGRRAFRVGLGWEGRVVCAAALRTERALVWGSRVGLGLAEREREVDFLTAECFEARREAARVFCSMREDWWEKRVSVLGRLGEAWMRRWVR